MTEWWKLIEILISYFLIRFMIWDQIYRSLHKTKMIFLQSLEDTYNPDYHTECWNNLYDVYPHEYVDETMSDIREMIVKKYNIKEDE